MNLKDFILSLSNNRNKSLILLKKSSKITAIETSNKLPNEFKILTDEKETIKQKLTRQVMC